MSTRRIDKCSGDDCACKSLRRKALRQPFIQIINTVSTIGGTFPGLPPAAGAAAVMRAQEAEREAFRQRMIRDTR